MRVKYNDKLVGKIDQRFNNRILQEGVLKDQRIKRRKRNFQLPEVKGLALRVIILLLVLGFVGLHLKEKPKTSIETPVTQENATQGIIEVAHAQEQVAQGDIFQVYFSDKADIMRAICKAESGLNPNAVGDTNTKYPSVGLCQIRLLPERQITMEQMKNPDENLKYAKLLYDKYGWKPWSAYKNGEYKKYLNQ